MNIIQENNTKIEDTTILQQNNKQLIFHAFYNPSMKLNRDITIYIINKYKQYQQIDNLNILDGLAGSGLRPIRFLQEIDNINKIHINDLSASSCQIIQKNLDLNGISKDKYIIYNQDVNNLYNQLKDIHVIDIDPFGTAVPFLHNLIQNSQNNQLLCITCTDSRDLMGYDTQKCFQLYHSQRQRNFKNFNEHSLRVFLYTLITTSNQLQKYVKILLSYQNNYYLRVYIQIQTKKLIQCSQFNQKIGYIFYCTFCQNIQTQSLKENKLLIDKQCQICLSQIYMMGPCYIGELFDKEFVNQYFNDLTQIQMTNLNLFKILNNFKIYSKEQYRFQFNKDEQINIIKPYGINLVNLFKNLKIPEIKRSNLENLFIILNKPIVQNMFDQKYYYIQMEFDQFLFVIFYYCKKIFNISQFSNEKFSQQIENINQYVLQKDFKELQMQLDQIDFKQEKYKNQSNKILFIEKQKMEGPKKIQKVEIVEKI